MDRIDLVLMLMQQHMNQALHAHQYIVDRRRRRRLRGRGARSIGVRNWISRRPEHGLYDCLMVEPRNEDPRAFQNFMRMPPDMFDEFCGETETSPSQEDTHWRAPLDPGPEGCPHPEAPLLLAPSTVTCSWLEGASQHHQYSGGEVCMAIVDEYL
ncbi:hypothetical protein GWK47_012243 [Chionoecetes opilio]|uniref:Uncharacterized protein n=1 Tax=Chionoecetes opilio TaxID=41210 RepID=A0A8J5C254_CHIOP|nr:hypothetical protein GWK47_012243 [Chionoecetes opilio]